MTINILVRIVFQDSETRSPFYDQFKENTNIRNNHICLEGVLVGWGCCCLQVTFQAQSLTECLRLYDQLLPLTAIMVSIVHCLLQIFSGLLVSIE
jgi:glutamate--cysteine ligase catalytic subunit